MTESRIPISDFDFDLPHELIAQEPLADRSASRLLVLNRDDGGIAHRAFRDLPSYLKPGDILVVNDSRVIPARLLGHRESGGKAELLLLRKSDHRTWIALARPSKRLRIGERIFIEARLHIHESIATVLTKHEDGQITVELSAEIANHLDQFGYVPLPPYITHRLEDDERYQTVYSNEEGSAAAPTAGLHFTPEVMNRIRAQGVTIAPVTLHVGLDTFRPVTAEFAHEHVIHSEWCSVSPASAQAITAARANGGRVIAVGTTAARTLETWGQRIQAGQTGPFDAFTRIYITPGYRWTMVDALLTNFHLPKSTLLLMISSFAGKDRVFGAYQEAIDQRYRFFSFGDAMLIV